MAQHDYVIDNQSSASARADLNSLFQAIASRNSGATAPTTTYANMIWYDTANDLLKMRNEANSGWITLGTVDQTNNVFNPNFLPATQAEAEAGSNNVKGMTPLRVSQAIAALVPAGTTVNYQLFTATGTWTKPAGISANAIVHFHVIGGGSGGGAYFRGNSGSLRTAQAGTGGGGYLGSVLASSLGATVSVTVGAGSSGATVGNGSGQSFTSSAGGTSSFTSLASATGGGGGQTGSTGNRAGGDGGAGSAGTLRFYGNGGAAGTPSVPATGGIGGGSFFGGGAKATLSGAGSAGQNYGGGGAGAGSSDLGGAGAAGVVVVEY